MGSNVVGVVGVKDGEETEGENEGTFDGELEGKEVVGTLVGEDVVGFNEGVLLEGELVGTLLDGENDGILDGMDVVGVSVGDDVGSSVGTDVLWHLAVALTNLRTLQ